MSNRAPLGPWTPSLPTPGTGQGEGGEAVHAVEQVDIPGSLWRNEIAE